MKTKIITQIALQTAANRPLKRAFAFYFSLKSFNTSGYFTSNQYKDAADYLQISLPTFYSRLQLCKQFKLTSHAKKSFTLTSYAKVCEQYEAQQKFHFTAQNDIQLVLDALAIRAKKQAMQQAFFNRLKKYPAIIERFEQITGLKISDTGFREAVLVSLLNDHKNANPSDSDFTTLNPDDNLNYASLSTLFGYNSRGGMAYKKRALAESGIAKAEKRQYSVNPHRYTSILGNVCYFRPDKLRVLTLPDDINLTIF